MSQQVQVQSLSLQVALDEKRLETCFRDMRRNIEFNTGRGKKACEKRKEQLARMNTEYKKLGTTIIQLFERYKAMCHEGTALARICQQDDANLKAKEEEKEPTPNEEEAKPADPPSSSGEQLQQNKNGEDVPLTFPQRVSHTSLPAS